MIVKDTHLKKRIQKQTTSDQHHTWSGKRGNHHKKQYPQKRQISPQKHSNKKRKNEDHDATKRGIKREKRRENKQNKVQNKNSVNAENNKH